MLQHLFEQQLQSILSRALDVRLIINYIARLDCCFSYGFPMNYLIADMSFSAAASAAAARRARAARARMSVGDDREAELNC